MGPLNKGVSEQIQQTAWINNPDLEITAEMLTRPVTDEAAAAGGARRRRRRADTTAYGGGGLPAEDSTAAGNVGSPLPLPAAAAAGSCGLAAAESAPAEDKPLALMAASDLPLTQQARRCRRRRYRRRWTNQSL